MNKSLPESNPLKSMFLVRGSAVQGGVDAQGNPSLHERGVQAAAVLRPDVGGAVADGDVPLLVRLLVVARPDLDLVASCTDSGQSLIRSSPW